jgi:hypothetical protein
MSVTVCATRTFQAEGGLGSDVAEAESEAEAFLDLAEAFLGLVEEVAEEAERSPRPRVLRMAERLSRVFCSNVVNCSIMLWLIDILM